MSSSSTEDLWNENPPAWAATLDGAEPNYRRLVVQPAFFDVLGPVNGLRVLDVGCGEGSLARTLASVGADVLGVDLALQMIELARAHGPCERTRFVCRDIAGAAADEFGRFDLTISFMALMNFDELVPALCAMRALLLDGGRVVIAVLHPCFSTRRSFWIREKAGDLGGLFVSEYFDRRSYRTEWQPHGSRTIVDVRHHRTLEDYFDAFAAAALQVTRLVEPRPGRQELEQHPWLELFARHAGASLIFELRMS